MLVEKKNDKKANPNTWGKTTGETILNWSAAVRGPEKHIDGVLHYSKLYCMWITDCIMLYADVRCIKCVLVTILEME